MKRESLRLVAGSALHLARRQLAVLTALALPVLIAALVAVGLPRYVLGQESDALRTAVAVADPHDRDLFADGSLSGAGQPPITADPATSAQLQEAGDRLRISALSADVRALTGPARYDVFGKAIGVDGPGIAQPDQVMPRFGLFYRSDVAAHIRYLHGSAPSAVSPGVGSPEAVGVLDVAISAEAAGKLKVDVGAVLDSHQVRVPYQLRITGVFEPVDPSAAYWSDASDLIAAALTLTRPDGDLPDLAA